ncbi:hypothetical protein NDU88_004023 [Pleurodeles waltl]|uniref:Uncharacterized protein n=1 Tax=Pleurodeles waltl TaxID=8319 RepID=A0AAV7L3G2_PLEWA|nr:hypothetical protein NDU88_004023 [Pleurodeles waltl]
MQVRDRSDLIKANVESKQKTPKKYFDNKKGAKESFIAEGDWVVIKLPTFVKKGNSNFSEPVKVELVSGNAVRVEGNKWWNKSKVVELRREFDPQLMVERERAAGMLLREGLLGVGDGGKEIGWLLQCMAVYVPTRSEFLSL